MLKKALFFLIIIICPCFSQAQQREVLDWNFFKYDRPEGARYQAFTWGNLSYRFKTISVPGENIKIEFTVVSKMDTAKSYFDRKQFNNVRLLKHEQGHADIIFIYAIKLKEAFAKTSFSNSDYRREIKEIWNRLYAEMNNVQLKYDDETDHSKNLDGQKKWDAYFSETIASF